MKQLFFIIALMSLISPSQATEKINGAGASFPMPLYKAWAKNYHRETGVRIHYDSIGSGGGIRAIKSRSVDFGASDAPLMPQELAKEGLLQFPTVIGGIVPVVNIPGLAPGQMKLDEDTLCGIYLGLITQWDDERIAALNPQISLPGSGIVVVHRSDESGTTAIFTDYLSKVCRVWKDSIGPGKSVNWPRGIGQKGNEGVAQYVKNTENAIGYVEFSYAKEYELPYTKLKNAYRYFVEPSVESFQAAALKGAYYPGLPVIKKDFYLWLTNAPGMKAWPITGTTFIILAKEKGAANKKVVKFFDWAYREGDRKAQALWYFPLPSFLKEKVVRYWEENGVRVQ